MKKYLVVMVALAVVFSACSKQKVKDNAGMPVNNGSDMHNSDGESSRTKSDRADKTADQDSKKCTLDKKCNTNDEPLVVEEGKCTLENKCKPAVEPVVVEEEKECRFENKCKPKEEPPVVEEEKECTLPKCQAN